jgi:Protein of unknown function (DUF2924).
MTTIDIDFDVYKALTLRRQTEEMTYNDVLRELLGLGPRKNQIALTDSAPSPGDWVSKGVCFPFGTEFRANHKGKVYYGKVESGQLSVNGQYFNSPSAAADAITGNPVNGWNFWECRFPDKGSWQVIKSLRK